MDEQIGRYRLIKPLGEGAMAAVYLAELETGIGFRRKVALKVVRQEFAEDRKFIDLMSREAMIGSMLQHPNIVQTLEFNEVDGRSFLALEFVEGQTLETLLAKRRERNEGGLPLLVALEAMVQVLKGLAYAHTLQSPEGEELGIVHRDLKPGNIMLSQHGLVKIMDFGIAKARIASANLTTAGQVRGTPIYMAPEQVTGKPLDGRSDQFAAATVLYELLTGKQLFIATNLIRIMQSVARAEVEDFVEEVSALHPGIGPVMAKMWAKRPDDRFESCDEPAKLLEDVVYDLKAQGHTTTPGASAPKAPAAKAEAEEPEGKGVFTAMGTFVRKLFASEKPAPPPPKKRKRRRKRKPAPQTRVARPAQPAPAPKPEVESEEPSFSSMDMVFEDSNTDEHIPAAPPPKVEAPRARGKAKSAPTSEPTQSAGPAQLGPAPMPEDDLEDELTQPPSMPGPTRRMAPAGELRGELEKKDEDSMDPFFYEDYD